MLSTKAYKGRSKINSSKQCAGGLNTGPLDHHANSLLTELSQLFGYKYEALRPL